MLGRGSRRRMFKCNPAPPSRVTEAVQTRKDMILQLTCPHGGGMGSQHPGARPLADLVALLLRHLYIRRNIST